MIDKGVICGKLSQLRERQKLLSELGSEPLDAFVAAPIKVSAAERNLQVSIEICLDVGQHLIAALGLPRPDEYRDVFRILGAHGVITSDFAARLEAMAGFRNRLVHAYAGIDARLVHAYLKDERRDFDEFGRQVAAFLATKAQG
jgi:uncharacterized protein YutE (UPF0331/DUF86 family)